MCGLAGYTGKEPVDVNALRILMIDNQSRGSDSIGVYGKQLFRTLGGPSQNVGHEEFSNAIEGAFEVIAHNRWGTGGKVTKENAHPFKVGEGKDVLYGTHNGFIPEVIYEKTIKSLGLEKAPDVDSQAIYQILYNHKMDFDVLSKIDAAMALAFVYDGKLHLYRRNSRPLFIGEAADHKLYYSSRTDGLFQIGCRYAQIVVPEYMHIFQKGRLIESTPVRKSRLHYLKEGVLPGSWEYDVKEDHKKFYPEVWRPVVKKHTGALQIPQNSTSPDSNKAQSGGGRGATTVGPTSLINPVLTATKPTEITELFEYLEMDILENSKSVPFPEDKTPAFHKYYESGDSESAIIVVALKDNVNEAPLANWTVGFKGNKDTYTITTGRGLAVIQLSEKYFRHLSTNQVTLELIAVDPFNYKEYYTKKIVVTKGRVVEGTLLVPFRAEEKAQKQNDFRKVEDNLLARAILYKRVVHEVNGQPLADKVVPASNANPARDNAGSTGTSGRSDEESQSQRIGRALATDLLLSDACGSEVFKSAVSLVSNSREAKRLYEKVNIAAEARSEEEKDAQSVQILGEVKDTDFTPVNPRAARGCNASGNREASLKLWDEMEKRENEKKDNMRSLSDGFLSDLEAEGINIHVVRKPSKPIFLPAETEELHIVDLINTFRSMENKAMAIVDVLQTAASEIGLTEEDYRKAIATAMADAINLGHEINYEHNKYDTISKQQDFTPF